MQLNEYHEFITINWNPNSVGMLVYYIALSSSFFSYTLMRSCWEREPTERPNFTELVSQTSSLLYDMKDYLPLLSAKQDASCNGTSFGSPPVKDHKPNLDNDSKTMKWWRCKSGWQRLFMSIESYTANTFILVNKNYMHRHFFNSLEQLFSFCFLYLFVRTIKQKTNNKHI